MEIPTKKIPQLDGCDDDEEDEESNFKSVGIRKTRSRAKKRSRPDAASGSKRKDKTEEKAEESPAKKISKMMRSSGEKVEKKKQLRLSAAVAMVITNCTRLTSRPWNERNDLFFYSP